MPRHARLILVGMAASVAALLGGCSVASAPPLSEVVGSSGNGYIFEPHPLPTGSVEADDVVEIVARYGGGRFEVERMEAGTIRPNIAGQSLPVYAVEVVDRVAPRDHPELILVRADTGEIIAAPGVLPPRSASGADASPLRRDGSMPRDRAASTARTPGRAPGSS